MLSILLYMVADARRRGYAHLLESFWDEARSLGLELPKNEPVSAASFCDARQKLKPELFTTLMMDVWQMQRRAFDESCRWRGRRVFAVDGTKITLERSLDLGCQFHYPVGAHCPQALVSALYDLGTKSPVALRISPYDGNEREHALELMGYLQEGDVLVLDRGYPSHEMVQALSAAKIDFLIRLPSRNSFQAIETLRESKSCDMRIPLCPPEGSNPNWPALSLRWIAAKDGEGEDTYYVTSLPKNRYSAADILDLYRLRWEIEEFYKLSKSDYIGQAQFRSKTANGIRQELCAQYLLLAMTRYLALQAADAHDDSDLDIDQKGAVLSVAAYLTRLLLDEDPVGRASAIYFLFKRMARHRYRRRKGRSFPRRSFKPARKWGPQGRVGA